MSSVERYPVWEATELEASSGLNMLTTSNGRKGVPTMRRKKRAKRRIVGQDIPKLEALAQINLNAAGLDIGDDEIYAAVPEGRDKESA